MHQKGAKLLNVPAKGEENQNPMSSVPVFEMLKQVQPDAQIMVT
jgi:hypothetical protein